MPKNRLEALAELYADPKVKVTSFWTMGFNQHTRGVWCNNLIYNCRGGYVDDGHGVRARSSVNLYRNYYRRGPQTQNRIYPYALSPHMSYYVRDNYFENIERLATETLSAIGYPGYGPVSERNVSDIVGNFGFSIDRVQDLPVTARSITDLRHRVIYISQRNEIGTRASRSILLSTLGH